MAPSAEIKKHNYLFFPCFSSYLCRGDFFFKTCLTKQSTFLVIEWSLAKDLTKSSWLYWNFIMMRCFYFKFSSGGWAMPIHSKKKCISISLFHFGLIFLTFIISFRCICIKISKIIFIDSLHRKFTKYIHFSWQGVVCGRSMVTIIIGSINEMIKNGSDTCSNSLKKCLWNPATKKIDRETHWQSTSTAKTSLSREATDKNNLSALCV